MADANIWFTGENGRIATEDDIYRNYPWYEWSRPYPERLANMLRSPVNNPPPEIYAYAHRDRVRKILFRGVLKILSGYPS